MLLFVRNAIVIRLYYENSFFDPYCKRGEAKGVGTWKKRGGILAALQLWHINHVLCVTKAHNGYLQHIHLL